MGGGEGGGGVLFLFSFYNSNNEKIVHAKWYLYKFIINDEIVVIIFYVF